MIHKYIALLRGINVGGHHKVPMAELQTEMGKLKFKNVKTLLNSGNVIFEADSANREEVENIISQHLEMIFGFPIPTVVIDSESVLKLLKNNPFLGMELTKEKRFYISFLKKESEQTVAFPWSSEDESYTIISQWDKIIVSVLDLSKSNTPKAMEALERIFGKEITTRNWNTIERIGKIL